MDDAFDKPGIRDALERARRLISAGESAALAPMLSLRCAWPNR